MSKKTWILISCLVLSLTLGLGGSLAYLTDTDTKINTFTMGNVDIEVDENFPESNIKPGVNITKEVWIENTGSNDAWVWMEIAVPANLREYIELYGEWNNPEADHDCCHEIGVEADGWDENGEPNSWNVWRRVTGDDGVEYDVIAILVNDPLPVGGTTHNLLHVVRLNDFVDKRNDGTWWYVNNGEETQIDFNGQDFNIVVSGFAIQNDGINNVDDAYHLYNAQWGEQNVPNIDSDDKYTWMVHSTEELQDLLKNDPNNKVITLASGTYEHVTLGDAENLIIRAAVGADPVVKGITIDDQTDGLKVSNLTIQGITFEGDGINFTFGDGSPWDLVEGLEVDNCRLYASKAENGAGLVDVHASSPGSNRMFDVIINNCHVNNAGWGVRLGAINNKATITNCLFENIYNNAVSLRGSSQADIVIKDNEIRNLSTRAFRIDNVLSGTVTYSNNTIENAIDLEDNSVLKFNGIADGASIVYEGTTYAGPMDKTAIQ